MRRRPMLPWPFVAAAATFGFLLGIAGIHAPGWRWWLLFVSIMAALHVAFWLGRRAR